MSDPADQRSWEFSLVEKIVGFVLIGLLGWMAVTVQQTNIDVAVIKAELATANRDRFTDQEGQRLADRIQRLEERISDIEKRSQQ